MISANTVNIASVDDFVYLPASKVHSVNTILIKPNLGYPKPSPVTVSIKVLHKVLQGLRKINPTAEILIVEGVCSPLTLKEIGNQLGIYSLLDNNMKLLDADTLSLFEYPNLSPKVVRFKSMLAPRLLQEVDYRITLGTFKRTHLKGEPLISASLKNLYGLFPRQKYKARSPHSRGQLHRPSVPKILQDVYFSIGHLFDHAIIDGTAKLWSSDWKPDRGKTIPLGQVCWGEDMIQVDQKVCEIGDEAIPNYLKQIEQLRRNLGKSGGLLE